MYRKTVPQSSFMPTFPSFAFWCFFFPSRNHVLIVYNSAVSVLMNYRSAFYSFRKVILGSESTCSLPFLKLLPGKKKRGVKPGASQTMHFTLRAACHSFLLYSWGSEGSVPELSFSIVDQGAWNQRRDIHTSACFQQNAKAALPPLLDTGVCAGQCMRNLQIQDQSGPDKHLHSVGQWSKIVKLQFMWKVEEV